MTNIGEILYATAPSTQRSREDGLAWTREAVDIAEEQLRHGKDLDKEGTKVCKECLGVAIDNWEKMVSRLAKEEKEKAAKVKAEAEGKGKSWWSGGWVEEKDVVGRWESEESVVRERRRRAGELLDQSRGPPPVSVRNFFTV
ncbi:hypothetical protein G7Y89_g15560 [Cudoniella acicularis]|uniref:Uncharacterized protein n=1 Tax=Cudoniella acicularis TaxID=354080 RepID=A0A8H4QKJ8_9HELO|nr:hypothetical protein G7Y89_g15560 [Cudoniella acicularis]